MTEDERIKCHAVIHIAAALAAGVTSGLVSVPINGQILVILIQIIMSLLLGAVFKIPVAQSATKGAVGTCFGAIIGWIILSCLTGRIHGLINPLTALVSACLTEALGWLLALHFSA